ncbi:MAG: type IX secretion system sortase PorU [Ignavibacteria bacterium]|nr:type IX secretion system sortase PorU [Ignavibacteria bacterium]
MKSKVYILLFILTIVAYPQNDLRILASDQNSIVMEYLPEYIDTSIKKVDNQTFRNIILNFGSIPNPEIWGVPAIPERKINIGVPSEFGNTIEVLNTQYLELSGLVLPTPEFVEDEYLYKYEFKVGEGYFNYVDNPELVIFGDFGITRGINNQIIKILPVKFDPSAQKIRLYKRIIFRITYSKGGTISAQPYDELLSSAFINYDVARFWQKKRKLLNKVTPKNSVLSSGDWVRFETPEEGIFKLDFNFLLSAGFDPSAIDPRTIKIFNNGGKTLSENLLEPRPVDLVENAIKIIGESDGKFDQGDYIIFYGRGSSFWDYDKNSGEIKRFRHTYSDHNYYWITYGGVNGKRIQDKTGLNTSPKYNQNSSLAFTDFEEDKINIGKSGRDYYGDDFSQAIISRSYLNTLNGRLSSEPINYKFRFANGSSGSLTLRISENNSLIFNGILNGYGDARYTAGKTHSFSAVFTGTLPDNRSVLKFSITPTSVTTVGYLDYFEISYSRDLKAFDNNILFFSKDTTAIIEYYLNGFTSTNIEVFDVTDYSNVQLITDPVQLSGGDIKFQISESEGNVSKYIAIGSGNYVVPVNPVSVSNSNLRGIQDGAKYIIIAPKIFIEAAIRLKNFRENDAPVPISTIVVDVDEIYNEFSSGVLDVTAIRDFIKYAYDNWLITPVYVLLLGKGTFDYRNIAGFNDNFIPTWQTKESMNLLSSFTSDDYFVNVDGIDGFMDLAPGRLTASNVTEANNYISKVIDYELNSKKGLWRNLITLVADDGFTSTGFEGSEHTRPTEKIANEILPKSFDLKKIYLADYPVVITGAGRRKPQVNEEIINTINNGTLLVNYIGHGSPELWAHEVVFEKSVTIPQLHNSEYFFLVAATCDFAYYDIPNFESGAEELLFLRNSGAIGGVSSARLVFSFQNHLLNFQLLTDLLSAPRDTLNLIRTMGASYFNTRQSFNGTNDKKYHLFGDPVLRLKVPQYEGKMDSINGQPLIGEVQVRALSNTKITGTILTPDNEKWADFNGEGILTVFDSERIKLLEQINDFPMVIQGGVIFNGRVSISNGEFGTNFAVPKDISYENKNGKVIFYFFDDNSDGLAFTKNIIVGGTDTTAVNDGEGPEIEIFFDDAKFNNAFLVGPEPNLIVKLSDETGLNTTGTGVGHKLEGILNGDNSNPIDFTNHFKGELDAGGKAGEINFKFSKMEEGEYNLLVKAWDVFNNFSSESAFFAVVSDDQLVIRDVYNYPNPFSSKTTFTFQHNLDQLIDVRVKIYTIAGRLIKEINTKNIDQKFVKIDWDGRDEDGDNLANGAYLYKINVRTVDGDFSKSILGKMAVIR